MDQKTHKIHNKYSRRSRHAKSKKPVLTRLATWAKKNPLKISAFLFVSAIIYISVLFYDYEDELKNIREDVSNNKVIKGILLPMRILSEISAISIDFAGTKTTVLLEDLKRGYKMSAVNIKNCINQANPGRTGGFDPASFTITQVDDRLYVSTEFRDLFSDKIIGSVKIKNWTSLSENIAAIRTDDYSFEVIDNKGNVNFNMQFIEPDIVAINGYFVGTECIYVANGIEIYTDLKTGNYVERALPQIRKIKKIW